MGSVRVLGLLLALSAAVNVGFIAGLLASHADPRLPQDGLLRPGPAHAVFVGAGAASTFLALFFGAVSAYR